MGSTVIEPTRGWVATKWRDLWEYRELLYFLVWRDIKVRYKQTALGAAWAVLQPLLTMVIFTLVFDRLAKIPSEGVPYPVFAYCALLPWQLFAHALTESSNSLVANQQLITKVYFPRLLVPMSAVLSGLLDFLIASVVLAMMMLYYGITPSIAALTLPLLVLMAAFTAVSVGFWLSALNVRYRDVRYTIPFLTQIWLLATPVAYPSSLVPDWIRPVFGLNPMAGVVEGFRWALLGKTAGPGSMMGVSVFVVLLVTVTGVAYFRRVERTLADVI